MQVTRSDNTNNQARPSVSELPTFLRGDSVFEEEPVSDEESRTVTRGRVPRCYGEEVVVPGPEKPQHSPPIEHPIPPAPHTRLKSPSRVFIQPRETVFGKTLPPPGLGFRGTQPRPSFAASQEPEPPSNPTEEDWEIEEEKGGTPSSQDRDRDEDDSWGREGWMG